MAGKPSYPSQLFPRTQVDGYALLREVAASLDPLAAFPDWRVGLDSEYSSRMNEKEHSAASHTLSNCQGRRLSENISWRSISRDFKGAVERRHFE